MSAAHRLGSVLLVLLGLNAMMMYGAAVGVNRYADVLAFQAPALYTTAFLLLLVAALVSAVALAAQSWSATLVAGLVTLGAAVCGLIGEGLWIVDVLSNGDVSLVDAYLAEAWPVSRWNSTVTFFLALVVGMLCLLGGRPGGSAASIRRAPDIESEPAVPNPGAASTTTVQAHETTSAPPGAAGTPADPAAAAASALRTEDEAAFEVHVAGTDHGPYTAGQLRQFVLDGLVGEETLVRPLGGSYVPASQVPGLQALLHRR